MSSPWDPRQYERFQAERDRPFDDLLALLEPLPLGARALDLGCGTGKLTRRFHERMQPAETVGIDSSETMLAESASQRLESLSFRLGQVEELARKPAWDVLISNACLQWIPDHPALFEHLAGLLKPGGQLAIQVPTNHDMATHLVAAEVAGEEPFQGALGGFTRGSPVLSPDAYSQLLFELGFPQQRVSMNVYPHQLPDREAAVEWVKGTLLTAYQRRLPPELWAPYLSRYRERLFERLPDLRPFHFPYKRTFIWARNRALA